MMNDPQSILFEFIEESTLDFKSLIEAREADFISFCKIAYPDRKNKFAFYSVKSKEFVRSNPTVVIQDVESIDFKKEKLSALFPQFVDWFKIPRFSIVVRNRIKVMAENDASLEIELVWIQVEGQLMFLNTKFLK